MFTGEAAEFGKNRPVGTADRSQTLMPACTHPNKERTSMPISSTDEEWDELVPENFDTTALLRAVDAVDVLREDLNDREGG
ncbi:hypothetical protein ALP66_05059, partial [Pseudomonas amygdali pv. photiniae]